jgi:hypothetical protein
VKEDSPARSVRTCLPGRAVHYWDSKARIHLPGRAEQYGVKEDSPASEVRIHLWDSPVKKINTADREDTALRKIQEPEYQTEKITSLVYVV